MKIAVYSGSFNPLHIGHQAIMEYLTTKRDFDWVYLVVSPKNPMKDTVSADTGEERYRAAVEAVRRHPELHVWVDDIELKMEQPNYTIKTLDALKAREPENDFTLVIGADNFSNFHQWRSYKRILSDYGVAVYPRKGYEMKELYHNLIAEDAQAHAYRIQLLDAPLVDISSTEIRRGIAEGRDMSKWLM